MTRVLEPGDRFPDFVLPRSDGRPTHLYALAGGRPVVLVLARRSVEEADWSGWSGQGDVIVVSSEAASGVDGFVDVNGDVLNLRIPEGDSSVRYVLDSNLRVAGLVREADPNDLIDDLLGGLSSPDPGARITSQAPVLLVDRLLDPDRCAFLVKLWEQAGAVETGVERSGESGRSEVLSDDLKSRQDHVVDDPKLTQLLTQSIGRRLLPEIERSFVYRPTHFEGFKIACYDAESSGFFHAHRDNLSPTTAHRRLAVSLNLNDGYTGGELRFPEFGPDRYCPAAGSALVFSCAHLHEVLPVTDGRRFTLLTFLYDESAKRGESIDPFAV